MIPGGHNLDFETLTQGWLHPPGDGWEGEEQRFRTMWEAAHREEQTIPEGLIGDFFDLFMKGVCNTIDPSETLADIEGKGRTNPYDFCVSGKSTVR